MIEKKSAPSTTTIASDETDENGPDSEARRKSAAIARSLAVGDVLLGRWELMRFLGEGGAGAVFAARDREQGGQVALKVLTRVSAGALYRLKNEFRALSDMGHPNLVRLLELAHDAEHWFVVMELVPGTDFMSYVRDSEGGYEPERLRRALRGLACGVQAIHASGKLHRDLKPSNVLVGPDGHVVIVDFGLVSGQHLGEAGQTLEGVFLGTPAYAAPEQLAGLEQSPATDWYAVGLMLFEALTGRPARPPLARPSLELSALELSAPSTLAEVPPDLDSLCVALLARDPRARPDGASVLAAIGAERVLERETTGIVEPPHFIGRERERSELTAAFRETRDGRVRVVLVHGPSGIGKSALVRCFLDELHAGRALTLSGRCYAREKVPYKAFDAVIDQLSRYLSSLPEVEVARLLPRDTAALVRMFPTLARVAAVRRPPERLDARDELNARVRSFHALKELLARIADRQPLVICVDDLQWGDVDSARLLCELVAAPDAPAALFACTYRSEERDTSPMLRELFADPSFGAASSELALAPLPDQDARTLVRSVDEAAAPYAESIVDEAKGNPFFLGELVRHLSTYGALGRVGDVIGARVEALGSSARALLEVVCMAGRPVPLTAALKAVQSSEATDVRELVLARLARTRTLLGTVTLEPYHDHVRESVSAALSGERTRALSLALAHAYEREQLVDPEAPVQFYARAGERAEAARWARAAADKAIRALAYDRAAELFRIAAEHPPFASDPELQVALANACEKAGRPIEAAEAFEAASALLPKEHSARARIDLLRRAMRLYLQAAHLDRGRALLRRLCRQLGVYYPLAAFQFAYRPLARLLRRFVSLVVGIRLFVHQRRRRIDTWLLGTGQRSARERERLETRFDVLWSAGTGLQGYVDYEGLWFLLSAFSTARKLGTPESLALVMMVDDLLDAMFRGHYLDVAVQEQRVARALSVARSAGRPELVCVVLVYAAMVWGHRSELRRVTGALDEADRLLREHALAAEPVSALMRSGQVVGDYFSGRLSRTLRQVPAWLREVKESRDVFHQTMLGVVGAHHHLILDAPDAASAMIEQSYALAQGFEHPLVAAYPWRASVELYRGHPERVQAIAAQARRSRVHFWIERHVATRRIWAILTDGHAATACFVAKPDPAHLREIERRIRALARETITFGTAAHNHLIACSAHLRGNRDRERAALVAAQEAYDACGIGLYATACRDRLGRVIGGDEGRTLCQDARAELTSQGVVNPERWLAMLSPGRY